MPTPKPRPTVTIRLSLDPDHLADFLAGGPSAALSLLNLSDAEKVKRLGLEIEADAPVIPPGTSPGVATLAHHVLSGVSAEALAVVRREPSPSRPAAEA